MLQEEFNDIVTKQMKKCWETLFNKGNEYSVQGDRLSYFKKAAAVMDSTPEGALFGKYHKEVWSEKITDSINYLLILTAIVEEEQIEQD